ncbi:ADOP family duplicated permease [Acidicapsa dinghuensis]|uniref:ADOP family duplicated permease n=1 Tax=Acidicapsa dinghuensis TaxID=2218256 RepID=A0ABW1EI13_9BACT|nr:ABC transporter permease [Acidicapsa dinghuensis]
MKELFRQIYYLFHRRRLDEELQDEMAFHREMAARSGRKNFGNPQLMRERAGEAWGWTWLDRLVQDLHYGARILRRSPGFTFMAVLVLAIGIGINVTAFSLFDMFALKPLPVRDADRIVRLERRSPNAYTSEMAYPSYEFYRDHAHTLSAAIAVFGIPPMQLDNDVQPTPVSFVTPNYFTELGTIPALGRMLDPSRDSSPSASPVVVITYFLWQHRFDSDPSIVGRVIHLDGKPATIVGVEPYDVATLGGQGPSIWIPVAQQPYFIAKSKVLEDWTNSSIRMWGKLAPGVTAAAAAQELRALTDAIRRDHPDAVWKDEFIFISPGGHLQVMQPEMYRVAVMIGVLTLLILIIACANLGGLVTARAVARQHEMGIRVAVGAGRWRIFRQLCTESLMLAVLGSIAAIVLAYIVLRITLAQLDAPKWISPTPDWRVLLFTVVATVVASVSFGFMPAIQIARQKQHKTIARQILVGIQIAGSSVLMIIASLMMRAALHALYTDPGFGYEQIVSVDPHLSRHGYSNSSSQAYLAEMESRLRATPGVLSVSLVKMPPLGHVTDRETTEINNRKVMIYPNWIAPEFFQTMGIPMQLGRTFHPGEKNVVIVSQSFAREQWPGQNPLGQTVGDDPDKSTVIGVAGDAHINALNDDDAVEQYWPMQPGDMPDMVIILRAAGSPGSLTPTIKSIAGNLDQSVFPEIRQLKALYLQNVNGIEKVAGIISLVGMVAIAISAVGIIGLVAFVVTQRTKEIAIRIALGARPGAVLSAVLHQFLWPVAIGIFAGITLAAFGSKLLRMVLFGIDNLDPLSYITAIALIGIMIALAMLLPAARALRLQLATILRYE